MGGKSLRTGYEIGVNVLIDLAPLPDMRGGYRGVWLQSTALEICLLQLQATEFQKLPDYSLQFYCFVLYSLQADTQKNFRYF